MNKLISPSEIWDKEEEHKAFCVSVLKSTPPPPGHMQDAAVYILDRLSKRLQGSAKIWKRYEEREKWKKAFLKKEISMPPIFSHWTEQQLYGNLMLNLSPLNGFCGIIKPVY